MEANEKSQLTLVSKLEEFEVVFEKLILSKELSNEEATYILTVALLSLKVYENDKRNKSYLEFGYYIILKYSLNYHDYKPLYDFSVDFGFYPIAYEILNLNLIELSIKDVLTKIEIEKFKYKNYIETLHQKLLRQSINVHQKEVSIIAPTSYGKSEYIIEHLFKCLDNYNKFAIIVPSKSLLAQTYRMLKKTAVNLKIIFHDEMYENEDRFIAVLTQERALRLLDKENACFDVLYIDEAHNLLSRDNRNILLTRLLRINKLRNPSHHVIYLSPLIDDSKKLYIEPEQHIEENRIDFNLKHPEYLLKMDSKVQIYNRYSNKFYHIQEEISDYIGYIEKNLNFKNFVYIRKPRDIEEFVRNFAERMPNIELDSDLNILIQELERIVHKQYWMKDLIEKGIIYLHGKMPDILKEYLEYKFKTMDKLKIIVANHVILEGINLPIDTMFILTVHSLKEREAINLIGRVNRLNNIFNSKENKLKMLMPKVHFVENPFNKVDLENYIKKLRSNIFKEKVENPILINYDDSRVSSNQKKKDYEIIFVEDFILNEFSEQTDRVAKILLKNNIHNYIDYDGNDYVNNVIERLKNFDIKGKEIIEIVYEIFLKDIKYKINNDLLYYIANYPNIRDYYTRFIYETKQNTLNKYIAKNLARIKSGIGITNNLMYVGKSFGEVNKDGIISGKYYDNKWVDISQKTDKQIINIILIKYKIDNDFVSYDLNNFINALYDLEVLDESQYNRITYGTENVKVIELKRLGLSINLINRLIEDNALDLFIFDENNNLILTNELEEYIIKLNDLEQFEINKYLL